MNAPATYPAPNELQLLLEDDALAISCQTIAQYRAQLTKTLQMQFSGAPAMPSEQHTRGRITAPVTPNGRAYGLIPEGKGWADDLINWSTREFRNPADAVRLAACWNAFAAWDETTTSRLRGIVNLLGLQSAVPEGDLSGYEFAVLGFVRREIERLKAAERDAARYRVVRRLPVIAEGTATPEQLDTRADFHLFIESGRAPAQQQDTYPDGRVEVKYERVRREKI